MSHIFYSKARLTKIIKRFINEDDSLLADISQMFLPYDVEQCLEELGYVLIDREQEGDQYWIQYTNIETNLNLELAGNWYYGETVLSKVVDEDIEGGI